MLHVSHVALATMPRVCQVSHVLNRSLHVSRLAAAINLKMPSLSPTMEEGQIVKWAKAEGEAIAPGDVICDIQTDKAVMSMEADDEGVLAKIVKPADSGSIKVGDLIAVVAEDGEDWQTVASSPISDTESADAGPPPPASESAAAPAMTGGSTPGTVINMPSLSPTMSEGTIVKWYKQEGESIGAGDVLCDIQTDKAVVSMESDDDGVVAKILISEGASGVVVGTPICLMVEEGQDWKDVAIPATTSGEAAAKPAATEPAAVPSTSVATEGPPAGTEFIHPPQTGPATALLLTQYNINPNSVDKSGPKGNLTKADVLKFIKDKALPTPVPAEVPLPQGSAPAPAAPKQTEVSYSQDTPAYVDIELSNMRKVIAKRLTESKQFAPHGYSTSTADLTAINRLRQEYIKSGFKVSINDFVISAVSAALQYVPQINANVVNDEPQYMSNIDISVAVATPNGLITPIVKNANMKSVQEISAEVKDLAGKAKENKLKLDEFQGGTFTISNLGMFGIAEFTAIINAPQLAILAVGGGRSVIDPDTMKPTTVMTATLSFDRRYIDEAQAADFMAVFQNIMERPELLGTGYLSSVRRERGVLAN